MQRTKKPKTESLSSLMSADLKKSGLHAPHTAKLKLTTLTGEQTAELTDTKDFAVPSMRIPYFDLETGKPVDFFRLKFLESPKPKKTAFGAKKPRVIKYFQPHGTNPRAYFPPLGKKSWKDVALNADIDVYITEGEKKAACGCVNGFYTIGLGGVWSWKSKKNNVAFLPELEKINWKGRRTLIAFDSDQATNRDIMMALVALGYELRGRGAKVQILQMEAITPSGKTGMDDYIVERGAKAFAALPFTELSDDMELQALNSELVYIRATGALYDLHRHQVISSNGLTNISFANRFMMKLDPVTGARVRTKLITEWLEWDQRREHEKLVFAPGEPLVLTNNDLNTWGGWGCAPKAGPASGVAPFLKLIDYMFKDAEAIHKQWFLQWLAYPLQNPGAKLFSAVLLYSLAHGTGKSLIGYTMGKIYGKHFGVVTQEDLYSSFNDWVVRKQFALGEEITGHENRRNSDLLKNIISREQITVNQKYQIPYTIADCCNHLLTTNHPDSLFLENKDRRYFIHEITGDPMPLAFYTAYDEWKEGDGPARLMHWLLHHVNCKSFNPKAPAPMTAAKEQMQELSRSDIDTFAHDLKTAPKGLLSIDGVMSKRELWTPSDLVSLYHIKYPMAKPCSTIAMSKALSRVGLRAIFTVTVDQSAKKLIPLFNVERWIRASHADRMNHYLGRKAESLEPRIFLVK